MIYFNQELDSNQILFSGNNNIVRFFSDVVSLNVTRAEITFHGFPRVLYPGPGNVFYFNFKEWITAFLNWSRFADATFQPFDGVHNNVILNMEADLMLETDFTFKVFFSDQPTDTLTVSYTFLLGVLQLETYKKRLPYITGKDKVFATSPLLEGHNFKSFVKYWKGFPFDFAYYAGGEGPVTFKNEANLTEYVTEEVTNRLARFLVSDGDTDVTQLDLLSLREGFNNIKITRGENSFDLMVEQNEGFCGTYLKWFNAEGPGYIYFLFHTGDRGQTNKDKGEVNNDFLNIENTISPIEQIGVSSTETISIYTDILQSYEVPLLRTLFDSPKIYLFTGQRFAKSSNFDWIEVKRKTTSFKTALSKTKENAFEITLELPDRNTLSL